ncbi:MAG TPA: hypothetical protein VF178_11175, partial [Gemmatimonadaceae bacterium]
MHRIQWRRLLPVLFVAMGSALAACGGEAGGTPAGSPGRGGAGRGRGGMADRPTPVEIETVSRGTVSRTSTIAG